MGNCFIQFYKRGDARNSSLDPCHFELQVLSKLASTLPCSVAEIDRFKGRRKESSLSDRDSDSTSPTGKESLYSEASLLGAV